MDNNPAPPLHFFDPVHHDSTVIALFNNEASAGQAYTALLGAGVPAALIEFMAQAEALHGGLHHPVQDLFVPEDDYQDFHHALGRGHLLAIVRPASAEMREAAVWALEAAAPLDLDEHGRHWRGNATVQTPRMAINHANLSRADMVGRAIGGRDEVILDMTGQKMTVRMMSEAEMAEAPFAPTMVPEHRPAPLAPPVPARAIPVQQTSYTYGVPMAVVQRMSPQEQVMAQPHSVEFQRDKTTRGTFLRVVDGQTCLGWRDSHPAAVRVRSYVTERSIDATS